MSKLQQLPAWQPIRGTLACEIDDPFCAYRAVVKPHPTSYRPFAWRWEVHWTGRGPEASGNCATEASAKRLAETVLQTWMSDCEALGER